MLLLPKTTTTVTTTQTSWWLQRLHFCSSKNRWDNNVSVHLKFRNNKMKTENEIYLTWVQDDPLLGNNLEGLLSYQTRGRPDQWLTIHSPRQCFLLVVCDWSLLLQPYRQCHPVYTSLSSLPDSLRERKTSEDCHYNWIVQEKSQNYWHDFSLEFLHKATQFLLDHLSKKTESNVPI